MPAFTTPDNIQYPIQTDPVVPLAGVFQSLAETTQAAIKTLVETPERTGNYTLALSDAGMVVLMNPSATATVTVPLEASIPFDVGTVINVYNASSNDVTITGASGVTVRNAPGVLAQYQEISLRKRATNEWVVAGRLD
jgi:hypothetical protein